MSRNSRDRWVFFNSPSRKVLSPEDVVYWKRTLNNILKVGMEFEFNLPEKKGSCEGDSLTCPCHKMDDGNCWKKCSNEEECALTPTRTICGRAAEKCKKDDCSTCVNFTFNCLAIGCSNFVPGCEKCKEFDTKCDTCEYQLDPEKDPDTIRMRLEEDLKPSHTYGYIGANGVHSIVQDGSLLGNKGAEVITIGRRTNYWEFYSMAEKIINETVERGGYVNERCSIHMHLLASYYGQLSGPGGNADKIAGTNSKISELEKDMPEIILANYHQLCRRYQNALTWMTMGLDEPNRMTRWEKFRVSILDISAMQNKMASVSQEVSDHSGGNKYGWINYKYTNFANSGDINRFHVEFRVMDGIMAPSVVAGMACLYHALLIKAVEISRYGILEIGDDEWMATSLKAKKTLLNNMKGYQDGDRWGDTSRINEYKDFLIRDSYELVHQCKHALMKLGPGYEVLEKLAETPVALLRCKGTKWTDVEKFYKVEVTNEGQLDMYIHECVDLRIVDECQNPDEWKAEVVGHLAQEEAIAKAGMGQEDIVDQVNIFVRNKTMDGELIWSERLGTMVKI